MRPRKAEVKAEKIATWTASYRWRICPMYAARVGAMVQAAFFNWLITAVILKAVAFLRREVKFGWVRAVGAALIAQILLLGFVLGLMVSAPSFGTGWAGSALALIVPVVAFAFGITVVRGIKGVKSVLFTALLTWAIFQGVVAAIASAKRYL